MFTFHPPVITPLRRKRWDGFGLNIAGATLTNVYGSASNNGGRLEGTDGLGVFNFAAAGFHEVTLVSFNDNSGTPNVELSAALRPTK